MHTSLRWCSGSFAWLRNVIRGEVFLIYIYIYIHIHTHIHTCICICIRICICICVCTCMCICICVCICICLYSLAAVTVTVNHLLWCPTILWYDTRYYNILQCAKLYYTIVYYVITYYSVVDHVTLHDLISIMIIPRVMPMKLICWKRYCRKDDIASELAQTQCSIVTCRLPTSTLFSVIMSSH